MIQAERVEGLAGVIHITPPVKGRAGLRAQRSEEATPSLPSLRPLRPLGELQLFILTERPFALLQVLHKIIVGVRPILRLTRLLMRAKDSQQILAQHHVWDDMLGLALRILRLQRANGAGQHTVILRLDHRTTDLLGRDLEGLGHTCAILIQIIIEPRTNLVLDDKETALRRLVLAKRQQDVDIPPLLIDGQRPRREGSPIIHRALRQHLNDLLGRTPLRTVRIGLRPLEQPAKERILSQLLVRPREEISAPRLLQFPARRPKRLRHHLILFLPSRLKTSAAAKLIFPRRHHLIAQTIDFDAHATHPILKILILLSHHPPTTKHRHIRPRRTHLRNRHNRKPLRHQNQIPLTHLRLNTRRRAILIPRENDAFPAKDVQHRLVTPHRPNAPIPPPLLRFIHAHQHILLIKILTHGNTPSPALTQRPGPTGTPQA